MKDCKPKCLSTIWLLSLAIVLVGCRSATTEPGASSVEVEPGASPVVEAAAPSVVEPDEPVVSPVNLAVCQAVAGWMTYGMPTSPRDPQEQQAWAAVTSAMVPVTDDEMFTAYERLVASLNEASESLSQILYEQQMKFDAEMKLAQEKDAEIMKRVAAGDTSALSEYGQSNPELPSTDVYVSAFAAGQAMITTATDALIGLCRGGASSPEG